MNNKNSRNGYVPNLDLADMIQQDETLSFCLPVSTDKF